MSLAVADLDRLPVHLRGERILLVPPDPELHLDNYLLWFNDPEVNRFLLQDKPMTRMAERKWFDTLAERRGDFVWAVHDERGRHIGATGVHVTSWRHRTATTGTVIGEKAAWGRGYGSEVMQLRTRWAFEELGLHRLESECFVSNIGSATCLERTGYRRIGIARQSRFRGGQWHDCILWDYLAADWFARQAGQKEEA